MKSGVLGKEQRRFFRMMRVSIAEETGEGHRSLLSSTALIRLPLNLRGNDKMSRAGPTYFLSLAVARPRLVTNNAG